jgi:hypothetical protein
MQKRLLVGLALCCTRVAAEPVPALLFDTDFASDADDLGALAMLHNLGNAGECELLAVMSWNTERDAAAAIRGLNAFFRAFPFARMARSDYSWPPD